MSREPSGRHATAPYAQVHGHEVEPVRIPVQVHQEPITGVHQIVAPAPAEPVGWYRIAKEFGFPVLAAGALAIYVVKSQDQAREERREMAQEHKAQLTLILGAHEKDREIIRQAFERQNALLEQMPSKMREALESAGGRIRSKGRER